MDESCHTYECSSVFFDWTASAACSCICKYICKCVMSRVWISHVAHLWDTAFICAWLLHDSSMTHPNVEHDITMTCPTLGWVMWLHHSSTPTMTHPWLIQMWNTTWLWRVPHSDESCDSITHQRPPWLIHDSSRCGTRHDYDVSHTWMSHVRDTTWLWMC